MHQTRSDTDPVIPEQEQQELPLQEYLKYLKASEGDSDQGSPNKEEDART